MHKLLIIYLLFINICQSAVVKTYLISSFGNGLKIKKLHKEISLSGHVNGFVGLKKGLTNVEVIGTSLANPTALDTLAASHEYPSLQEAKDLKILEIDAKTLIMKNAGFTFKSQVFPSDFENRTKWAQMHQFKNFITFPLEITKLDHSRFNMTFAKVDNFVGTALAFIIAQEQSAYPLIDSVMACSTIACIDAIQDNR